MKTLFLLIFFSISSSCLAQADLQRQAIRGEWTFVGVKDNPFAEIKKTVNFSGKYPASLEFSEDGTWRAEFNLFKAISGGGYEKGSYVFRGEPPISQFKMKKMTGTKVVYLYCDVHSDKIPHRIFCFPDGMNDIIVFQSKK